MTRQSAPSRITLDVTKPHAVVETTRTRYEQVGVDTAGMFHLRRGRSIKMRVSPASISRALRVADMIFELAETQGHKVSLADSDDGGAFILAHGERVELSVSERCRQVPHEPTPDELARLKRYSWTHIPKFDYVPTGELTVAIDSPYGCVSKWSDGKRKSLEELIPKVVAGIEDAARRKAEIRVERLRREQEEWERQQRRAEEARRRDDLKQQIEAWRLARDIREFSATMRQAADESGAPIEPGGELDRQLSWAEEYADRIDPVAILRRLFEAPT
jgi:hypothetical protein